MWVVGVRPLLFDEVLGHFSNSGGPAPLRIA
jgi:hypothetical protein